MNPILNAKDTVILNLAYSLALTVRVYADNAILCCNFYYLTFHYAYKYTAIAIIYA